MYNQVEYLWGGNSWGYWKKDICEAWFHSSICTRKQFSFYTLGLKKKNQEREAPQLSCQCCWEHARVLSFHFMVPFNSAAKQTAGCSDQAGEACIPLPYSCITDYRCNLVQDPHHSFFHCSHSFSRPYAKRSHLQLSEPVSVFLSASAEAA